MLSRYPFFCVLSITNLFKLATGQPWSGPNIITIPNDTTIITAGDTLVIRWENPVGSRIIMRFNNPSQSEISSSLIIAERLENTGSYSWIVPNDAPTSDKYVILIMPGVSGENFDWSYSDRFTVQNRADISSTISSDLATATPASDSVSAGSSAPPSKISSSSQITDRSTTGEIISTTSQSAMDANSGLPSTSVPSRSTSSSSDSTNQSPQSTNPAVTSSSSTVPVGAIVGGVVGGLAVLLVGAYLILREVRKASQRRYPAAPPAPDPGHQSIWDGGKA